MFIYDPVENMTSKNKRELSNDYLLGGAFLLMGFYLLAGSFSSIVKGTWPFFMPAQLDIVGLIFSVFGDPAAGILGGIILGLLGFGSIYLCYLVYRK